MLFVRIAIESVHGNVYNNTCVSQMVEEESLNLFQSGFESQRKYMPLAQMVEAEDSKPSNVSVRVWRGIRFFSIKVMHRPENPDNVEHYHEEAHATVGVDKSYFALWLQRL